MSSVQRGDDDHGLPQSGSSGTLRVMRRLPKGFSVCFYDEQTGETLACPRDYSVECIGRQHYLFTKGDQSYSVDLEESTCTCPDFLMRRASKTGASCKHLRLARSLFSRGVLPCSEKVGG